MPYANLRKPNYSRNHISHLLQHPWYIWDAMSVYIISAIPVFTTNFYSLRTDEPHKIYKQNSQQYYFLCNLVKAVERVKFYCIKVLWLPKNASDSCNWSQYLACILCPIYVLIKWWTKTIKQHWVSTEPACRNNGTKSCKFWQINFLQLVNSMPSLLSNAHVAYFI